MNYDKPLLAMLIGAIVIIPLEIMGLFFKHLGWLPSLMVKPVA